ncbi:hypothetical protein FE257_003291 [Aspergillus nanangensis]|uniref:Uncharacterized protein n=1 Tax=Aspergillus nanangensis TaxID=2582783 RepID=A0AAD4CSC5_ASPNN|nr:hypothetical protein FE257_003291 [Aspergillus nanangensis]
MVPKYLKINRLDRKLPQEELSLTRNSEQDRLYSTITKVHRLIESLGDSPLKPSTLRGHGVQTEQRQLISNDRVLFSPCFFAPQPRKSEPSPPSTRTSSQVTDDIVQEQEMPPRPLPHLFRLQFGEAIKSLPPTFGMQDYTTLSDRGPLEKEKWKSTSNLRLYSVKTPGVISFGDWSVGTRMEDPTHEYPHAIIEMTVNSRYLGENLTAGEMKAVLRTMKLRLDMCWNRKHTNFPTLVLSYITPNHGRIIQAHVDKESVVIQYSKTLDLKRLGPFYADLFYRYHCSELTNNSTWRFWN